MREAIALAEKGRWHACPNPTVGAVLVRDEQIVARGWHHAAGQDHAEVDCIKDAAAHGIDPADCTMVVTLEPCCHQGKTPPCTDAVRAAGIKRVVVGLADPNPEACGGACQLRASGMKLAGVSTGGDPGHAPARRAYEKAGYTPFPNVWYYQPL